MIDCREFCAVKKETLKKVLVGEFTWGQLLRSTAVVFLAVIVFALTCLFWSKIATGSFAAFDAAGVALVDTWHLDRFVLSGISIYEYPWQIFVLGFLMGVIGITPVLVSQLMSFSHALPFLLSVLFLANMPGLTIALYISCVGVACRPLRFRSRIISVALCMAPQLIYWGIFGGARDYEALLWGVSFAPWACAWLVGLSIAGIVLAIGHFTRYKPGLIWIVTGLFLGLAVGVFQPLRNLKGSSERFVNADRA